jgi:hypothetical protein
MTVKTEALLQELTNYFLTPERRQLMDKLRDGSTYEKIEAAIAMVPEAIFAAEKLDHDLQLLASGEERKDTIVNLLDAAIRLPAWLEILDGMLLSKLIDQLVAWYNNHIGHDWLSKIRSLIPGM